MLANPIPIEESSRFLVHTLDHLWRGRGWDTGLDQSPHPCTLSKPDLWLRPADRQDVALFLFVHGPDDVDKAREAVALTAASAVDGAPRWIGCVQVFDVRRGGEELGRVARLGHAMACELGSFLYHAATWRSADHVVELARTVDDVAQRLTSLAGVR